jgi:hemoglobin-like flavoprotein
VGVAVAELDTVENIIPVLQDLGLRHAKRGVLPEHYPIIGKGLINTLRAGIKGVFTPAVRKSWE